MAQKMRCQVPDSAVASTSRSDQEKCHDAIEGVREVYGSRMALILRGLKIYKI